jgi:hypothetical protein
MWNTFYIHYDPNPYIKIPTATLTAETACTMIISSAARHDVKPISINLSVTSFGVTNIDTV